MMTPFKLRIKVCTTGLFAHGAIMASLLQRDKTGLGQHVECDLLSTQLSCLANLASHYLNRGIEASRWGTAHENIVPYQSFNTKDNRWITIGAGNDGLFHELCGALELNELKDDPRYASNHLRVENRVSLINALANRLQSQPSEHWLRIFEEKKVRFPYGPVNDMNHTFNDPHVQQKEMVKDVGPYKVVGPAVTFSTGGNYVRSQPPQLGEHTKEVLKFLGYADNEIGNLYANSIVQ